MPSQYIEYNCCAVVDGCRTFAYMNTVGHMMSPDACLPGTGFTDCGCCIPPTEEDIENGLAPATFVSPVLDPAPWYSPDDPRSSHYLGALLMKWDESQPYIRETVATGSGGKAKGAKLRQKEVVARFLLAVDDCCAINFAKAYFTRQMTCTGSEASCDPPSLEWHECYNPENCNSFPRAFRGMPLTSVTNIEYLDDEMPCCLGTIAEVTFASELPWIYEMCSDVLVDELPIVDGDAACTICPEPCPEIPEPCANPCSVTTIELPVEEMTGCYCEPWEVYQNCFKIDSSRRVGEDTLKITVSSGSHPLNMLRFKAWPNPIGVDEESVFRCVEPCIDIAIPGPIPAHSKIEIDGMTRRSLLYCGISIQNGRRWIESGDGSPFSWPDVGCEGLFVCLTSDAAVIDGIPQTASDATIKIERFHRELR